MSHSSTDGAPIGRSVPDDPAGFENARVQRAKSGAYAAIASGLAMGVIGALGLVANQPWLFPSLGPTIFLQAVTPDAPSARLRNTIAGHAVGVCAGFAALFLFGAQTMPAVMSAEVLSVERVAATALSVAVTVGVQSLLNVQHPPAAATTMLITLGGLRPVFSTVLSIMAGVLLVSVLGRIVQIWHPDSQSQV
jgi:hypothetical protein